MDGYAPVPWDAVIAENDNEGGGGGGVRDFIEAFAVSMLLFVRSDVLAQSDFGMCLRRLQKFPPVEDIGVLVERAKVRWCKLQSIDSWRLKGDLVSNI